MMQAALLNHLWQSTIFGLVAALVALALRRHQARVRFWVWLAASLKFLVPFAAFAAITGWARGLLPAPAAHAATAPALVEASQPFSPLHSVTFINLAGAPASHGLFYALLAVWAAGAAALACRWAVRWRRAAQADADTLEPGVYGIFRQRIVLPPGLAQRLDAAQLEAVVAHERCHIRRHDNLWSALHMVAETLFWFHPLVWIAGERLVRERERACDEQVLGAGCDRGVYASAMLAVCRHYLQPAPELAAGISGGGLAGRVRAVLGGRLGQKLTRTQRAGLGAVTVAVIAGPILLLAAQQAPQHFEAATIKPAVFTMRGNIRIGFRQDPRRLEATGVSLRQLIERAYDLKPYQVKGPSWINGTRFDITAVTAQPVPNGQQMNALLQPLLAERFHLHYHWTTVQSKLYSLEVAPGGSKLQRAKPGDGLLFSRPGGPQAMRGNGGAGAPGDAPGQPPGGPHIMARIMANGTPGGGIGSLTMIMEGTMDSLAQLLSQQLDEPVVNHTGLKGDYAVKFTYAMPQAFARDLRTRGLPMKGGDRPPAAAAGGSAVAPGSNTAAPLAPPIFTALEQQLGLHLVSGKGAIKLLVVDQALRSPTAN